MTCLFYLFILSVINRFPPICLYFSVFNTYSVVKKESDMAYAKITNKTIIRKFKDNVTRVKSMYLRNITIKKYETLPNPGRMTHAGSSGPAD